jgi:hypothetical protein
MCSEIEFGKPQERSVGIKPGSRCGYKLRETDRGHKGFRVIGWGSHSSIIGQWEK